VHTILKSKNKLHPDELRILNFKSTAKVLNIKIKSQDNRPHLQRERNSSWTWNTVNVLCKCCCQLISVEMLLTALQGQRHKIYQSFW